MSIHIQELNIKTYRGIQELKIDSLSDINVLVGGNNFGKTSILEAIMLLKNPNDIANIIKVGSLRNPYLTDGGAEQSIYEVLTNMFYKKQEKDKEIYVSATGEKIMTICKIEGNIKKVVVDPSNYKDVQFKNRIRQSNKNEINQFVGFLRYFKDTENFKDLKINITEFDNIVESNEVDEFINIKYLSTIDHIVKNNFNEIIKNKDIKKSVLNLIKHFDENILDLLLIPEDDGRITQVIDDKLLNYMPLSSYGDGIKKIIAIANAIAEAKNGILLIDEIETAIHTSALKKVINFIFFACKENNVQIFLTTHNKEVLDLFLEVNKELNKKDFLRVITLVKDDTKTYARNLSADEAFELRKFTRMELR